jgi:hypothetical protein
MTNENDLLKGSSGDSVKALRELTELLMGAVPTGFMEFIRQPHTGSPGGFFKTLYKSLTPEQREAIKDKDRKLLFTDLTPDQQVYLKQVFHQMWMWQIANQIVNPPSYTSVLEESRFFLRGKPGEKKAVMSIRWENPQSDRQINIINFGV